MWLFDGAILVLTMACLGSFAWAARNFFVRPSGFDGPLFLVREVSTVLGGVHLVVLIYYLGHGAWLTNLVALALGVTALSLFWWTLRSCRETPLLFVFASDAPERLITSGPYAYVRHPFYTSYILSWFITPIAAPAWWLAVTSLAMFFVYRHAAQREERELLSGAHGDAYRVYQSRTGRFFPRLAARKAIASG